MEATLELLNIKEAAAMLQVSVRHVRKLIKDGSINHGMIGNSYRFKRLDIIEYANSKFKNKK